MKDDQILEAIVRLETKMDTVGERINDHGQRLRVLEGFAKTATGAVAIAGIVAGWFKVQATVK